MASGLAEAYLRRIGFVDEAGPTLETLSAIHALHVSSVPFENLDPLLGSPVALDLATLREKLIDRRRGGYCFEQNTLMKGVLEELGFSVTCLLGRVRWMAAPDAPMGARTHMMLKVDMPGGPYLVDVGFGVHLQDAPLQLWRRDEQQTPAATYRIAERDGLYSLEAKQPDGWRTTFIFTLEPQHAADFVVANWYTSTHPEGLFTRSLVAERLAGTVRYRLFNRRLIETVRDGKPSERTIASADDLGDVLDRIFLLVPPAPVSEIFARLPSH